MSDCAYCGRQTLTEDRNCYGCGAPVKRREPSVSDLCMSSYSMQAVTAVVPTNSYRSMGKQYVTK